MNSNIAAFKVSNPSVEIEEKDNKYILKKLWNDDSFVCVFKQSDDFSFLDNIILPEEFMVFGMGIALKKDNLQLSSKIQKAINILKQNGTLLKLEQKWNTKESSC